MKKPKKKTLSVGFLRWVLLVFFGWVFRMPTLHSEIPSFVSQAIYLYDLSPAGCTVGVEPSIAVVHTSCILMISAALGPAEG